MASGELDHSVAALDFSLYTVFLFVLVCLVLLFFHSTWIFFVSVSISLSASKWLSLVIVTFSHVLLCLMNLVSSY